MVIQFKFMVFCQHFATADRNAWLKLHCLASNPVNPHRAYSFFRSIFFLYVMTTITPQVPDSLGEHQNDTMRFIAAKLYESGKLSLGQAAGMVGLSKRTFAELLGDYGVSLLNYPISEMLNDAGRINIVIAH